MRSIGWINLAAIIISIMVLAIAAILVPDKSWNATSIFAILTFSLALGFVFYIPTMLVKRQSGNDAAQMASIGPLGIITGGVILLTSIAFVLAMQDLNKPAWVMEILAIGLFIVSGLMLRASTDVIGNAQSLLSRHARWQGTIQGLSFIATDNHSKTALEQLSEKLRYAANDIPSGTQQDNQIEIELQALSSQLNANAGENAISQISKINVLISQREVILRSARSRA